MKDFSGKLAVITGGATGIGRALTRQLAEAGCSVAMCDVSAERMAESRDLALKGAPQGVVISTFVADVSDRARIEAWRDAALEEHQTDCIHLLFNNAGISGGGSFLTDTEAQWRRVFNVCWGGVYNNARVFMPALLKADEARIINVSSVNGFFASVGPGRPHTAYSAAKFAVKGFTEALMEDLKLNAPHVKAHLVMPGHIGTKIAENSVVAAAEDAAPGTTAQEAAEAALFAQYCEKFGLDPEKAAAIILDGVRQGRWRILVGEDAEVMDREVRASPEEAYTEAFFAEKIAPASPGYKKALEDSEG